MSLIEKMLACDKTIVVKMKSKTGIRVSTS